MKKYVRLILAAAAVLTVATGCSKQEAKETTAAEETVEALKKERVNPGKIVKLGNYMGLELTKQSTEVSEEELQARLNSIVAANPDIVEVDRPAKLGDTVNIDYVGKKDGEPFAGGTAEGYDLTLGSHSFIDGFEDGLVGVKAGDKKNLDLTFPEQYHSEDLAGKAVVFEVTVNAVKETKDAVLDDAFVQKMSEFKTVDEFKADTFADMEKEKEDEALRALEDDALGMVFEASEFEVNPEAVDQMYDQQYNYMESMVTMYGSTMEEYAQIYGRTLEEYQQELRLQSETSVKQQILFDAIAEAEHLELTDEDRQRIADMYGMELDKLKEMDPDNLDATARAFKTIDYIVDNAVIK